MNTGKIVLGVLAGAATGALLGVLFAPDKGTRTRKRIVEKGQGYVDELKDKFDGFCESITDKLSSMEKEGEELVNKGKGKYQAAKS